LIRIKGPVAAECVKGAWPLLRILVKNWEKFLAVVVKITAIVTKAYTVVSGLKRKNITSSRIN
jgi:hypothetical protein